MFVEPGLGERDDAVGEAEAEGDPDHPACERGGQASGREDPSRLSGVGGGAAQHADLAGAFDDGHSDRVDQPDHADRDDQQAQYGDRGGDAAVGGAVVLSPTEVYASSVIWSTRWPASAKSRSVRPGSSRRPRTDTAWLRRILYEVYSSLSLSGYHRAI